MKTIFAGADCSDEIRQEPVINLNVPHLYGLVGKELTCNSRDMGSAFGTSSLLMPKSSLFNVPQLLHL